MSFPQYPMYKESGVEWLGAVPAHWDIMPVNRIACIINGYPFDSALFDPSEGIPLVRIRDLNGFETEVYYNGPFVEPVAITSEDVLIGMDGDFNVGRWRGKGRALLNQRMCCVRGSSNLLTRLLEYALPFPLKSINDVTYSTTVKHLASSQVEKTRVAFPPDPLEQLRILNFLDQEIEKIDRLISEQRRLVELLKEKRQAVISHAVTKGLNLNAPMKPSGYEWIGEVPAHWDIKRLRFLVPQITVGIVVEPSKYYVDEGVPALRSLNIRPGAVSSDNLVFISIEANELHSKSKLRAGDLVAVRSGQPGTTAVVPAELDGCNCIDLIIIRKPDNGCEWFYCWYLASEAAISQFSLGSGGAIQQHFNIGTAMDLIVPVPPIDEQPLIAAYVEGETARIDHLTAEAQRAIDLLQERRSALISAAVTGKIDVRGLAESEAA